MYRDYGSQREQPRFDCNVQHLIFAGSYPIQNKLKTEVLKAVMKYLFAYVDPVFCNIWYCYPCSSICILAADSCLISCTLTSCCLPFFLLVSLSLSESWTLYVYRRRGVLKAEKI